MFYKLPDGSVHDEHTRMLYFSTEGFIRNICESDRCFICGSARDRLKFEDEHILSNWILRRYKLHGKEIVVSNLTAYRYGGYKIPCCYQCNRQMGAIFENPIRELIAQGYDAVIAYVREKGAWLFFIWLTLIFLKTHLKDRELPQHRDPRLGTGKIADTYAWESLHHLHCVARAFYSGCKVMPEVQGSVFILKAEPETEFEEFDFCDLYPPQTVLMRLGDTAFIAVLNDAGAARKVFGKRIEGLPGPLTPMQLREFMARCALVNLNLVERPVFSTEFNGAEKRFVITAQVPPLAVGACPSSQWQYGEMLHRLTIDYLDALPVERRQVVEEAVKQGRYTFFNQPLNW